jgi:UDP-GlcNAc:undecaprenyl-phosphate/decaprenyl-phosphate GlcNAc-1-phosphate transferase
MVRRANYRGREVAFPLGVVLVGVSVVAFGALAALAPTALDPGLGRWLPFLLGASALGLVDDLFGGTGPAAPRGWRGHARAVRRGELSTGAIKAAGTLGLAAYATAGLGLGAAERLVDVGVLVLATNAANLIDLRPGRAEKCLFLVLLGLCIGGRTLAPIELLAVFLVPVLVGAWYTLRERAMLGDTGASLLGALAGISLVTTLPVPGRLIALGVLVALTIYGEFRSISTAIERNPLLSRLDLLGRVELAGSARDGDRLAELP